MSCASPEPAGQLSARPLGRSISAPRGRNLVTMGNMSSRRIDSLVDTLSTNGVANVQGALIHTAALWMDRHVKGDDALPRKKAAFFALARTANRVVSRQQLVRKRWPQDKPLPSTINEVPVIHALSRKLLHHMRGLSLEDGMAFLGELWGRWVLICPIEIVRNSPEFASATQSGAAEDELAVNMLRYLDIYANM